jgi:hypothetical protein
LKSVPESVDGEDLEGVPLFEESGELAYIAVTREDPEEGFLGKLRPTATEADLRKKWGGGTYSLSPRSSGGKYLKGLPARELIIAGDPIFSSRAAELKWKRAQGIADDQVGGGANGGGSQRGDRPLGLGEIMVLLSNSSTQARAEAREAAELRAREAETAHQRQLELMRGDLAKREAELKAERERLSAEAAEREQRLSREMSAERDRQRDHMASMLQLMKERGKRDEDTSPMQMLTAGIKLALDLKGDGDGASDPVTALANNLPEILSEARSLVMMEKAGTRVRSKADDDEEEEDEDGVKLEGEVAQQAKELVARLQAQGRDPAVYLAKAFGALGRGPRKPPAAPPAPIEATATTVSTTPAPAPASAPELKQPLKNGHAAQKPTRRRPKSTAKAKPATA